ncbi:hypothetical protein [Spartinivicinus ruber]|uniref:hypothetical protein n=1 Tax=Spartinivicinus ruber TaxID=2683272 RepID=UPI001E501369|nr:hypothetical protein [Spartinivicinus ruber]
MLAFIPQFVEPNLGSVTIQLLGYGIWFAVLTGLNIGAGISFLSSGLAVALMKQK